MQPPELPFTESLPEPKDWSKGSRRPATISGSGGTVMMARKEKDGRNPRPTGPGLSVFGKSARMLIHEEANVGEDLPSRRSAAASSRVVAHASATVVAPANPPATTFLKPDGVDTSEGFMRPAGVDAPMPAHPKRSRDAADDQTAKKKKRKSKTPGAEVE
jgi:hypothetical protein